MSGFGTKPTDPVPGLQLSWEEIETVGGDEPLGMFRYVSFGRTPLSASAFLLRPTMTP